MNPLADLRNEYLQNKKLAAIKDTFKTYSVDEIIEFFIAEHTSDKKDSRPVVIILLEQNMRDAVKEISDYLDTLPDVAGKKIVSATIAGKIVKLLPRKKLQEQINNIICLQNEGYLTNEVVSHIFQDIAKNYPDQLLQLAASRGEYIEPGAVSEISLLDELLSNNDNSEAKNEEVHKPPQWINEVLIELSTCNDFTVVVKILQKFADKLGDNFINQYPEARGKLFCAVIKFEKIDDLKIFLALLAYNSNKDTDISNNINQCITSSIIKFINSIEEFVACLQDIQVRFPENLMAALTQVKIYEKSILKHILDKKDYKECADYLAACKASLGDQFSKMFAYIDSEAIDLKFLKRLYRLCENKVLDADVLVSVAQRVLEKSPNLLLENFCDDVQQSGKSCSLIDFVLSQVREREAGEESKEGGEGEESNMAIISKVADFDVGNFLFYFINNARLEDINRVLESYKEKFDVKILKNIFQRKFSLTIASVSKCLSVYDILAKRLLQEITADNEGNDILIFLREWVSCFSGTHSDLIYKFFHCAGYAILRVVRICENSTLEPKDEQYIYKINLAADLFIIFTNKLSELFDIFSKTSCNDRYDNAFDSVLFGVTRKYSTWGDDVYDGAVYGRVSNRCSESLHYSPSLAYFLVDISLRGYFGFNLDKLAVIIEADAIHADLATKIFEEIFSRSGKIEIFYDLLEKLIKSNKFNETRINLLIEFLEREGLLYIVCDKISKDAELMRWVYKAKSIRVLKYLLGLKTDFSVLNLAYEFVKNKLGAITTCRVASLIKSYKPADRAEYLGLRNQNMISDVVVDTNKDSVVAAVCRLQDKASLEILLQHYVHRNSIYTQNQSGASALHILMQQSPNCAEEGAEAKDLDHAKDFADINSMLTSLLAVPDITHELSLKDKAGHTALFYAYQKRNFEAVVLLESYGAKLGKNEENEVEEVLKEYPEFCMDLGNAQIKARRSGNSTKPTSSEPSAPEQEGEEGVADDEKNGVNNSVISTEPSVPPLEPEGSDSKQEIRLYMLKCEVTRLLQKRQIQECTVTYPDSGGSVKRKTANAHSPKFKAELQAVIDDVWNSNDKAAIITVLQNNYCVISKPRITQRIGISLYFFQPDIGKSQSDTWRNLVSLLNKKHSLRLAPPNKLGEVAEEKVLNNSKFPSSAMGS